MAKKVVAQIEKIDKMELYCMQELCLLTSLHICTLFSFPLSRHAYFSLLSFSNHHALIWAHSSLIIVTPYFLLILIFPTIIKFIIYYEYNNDNDNPNHFDCHLKVEIKTTWS